MYYTGNKKAKIGIEIGWIFDKYNKVFHAIEFAFHPKNNSIFFLRFFNLHAIGLIRDLIDKQLL